MEPLKVLSVSAGGLPFALDVGVVRAIDRPARWARLPWAPPYVTGVSEVAGQVVAVLALAARLGLAPGEPGAGEAVILVEAVEPVALEVEAIGGVRTIDPAEVRDLGERGRRAAARGILADGTVLLAVDPLVDGRPLTPLRELLAAERAEGDSAPASAPGPAPGSEAASGGAAGRAKR